MGYRLTAEEKARRAERRAALVNTFKPGDVVYRTWGYDQTNVDYFEVLATTPKGCRLLPLANAIEETGFMCGNATPVLGTPRAYDAEPFLARLTPSYDGTGLPALHIEYGDAHLWHGRPVRASWYG